MESAHHFFVQTSLQQYSRGAFFYSAHCSFSNPICFWSVWCRRTMIPGKIFTSFAKFQRIVSVNDFRFPMWLPRTFASSFCVSWEVFVLHGYDWIHWVAKSLPPRLHIDDCFKIHNFHWELCVICCYHATKNFHARGTAPANASSARGPRNFGPLTDLAISVFREASINTVFYPNPHFS